MSKILDSAIKMCDRLAVVIDCVGEDTSFEHYAIFDASNGRIVKDNFKTESEAIKYAKSKGYDVK